MINNKLLAFEKEMHKKNVTVIGIGISNLPLIKYLVKLGANVTACDKRTKEKLGKTYDELTDLGVTLHLGDNYLDNISADIIFKTPGMRYDIPELNEARQNGSIITSEMEVFFELCPSNIIAITGSDGKTTTTTLVHKILTEEGYKTWLGGNIGNPLLTQVGNMQKDDYVVLELSSFQLHTMRKSPKRAVITNITPNHLDMHKDYQEYIDAKKNIMLYQNTDDLLVVNEKNDVTREIGDLSNARVLRFTSDENKENSNVHIDNGCICFNGEKILKIEDIKLPGMHNVENYMAAIAVLDGLAKKESILKVAKEFGGVEHRIELVRILDGVKYYNSSIDSSPNRTINTLKVFSDKVIMIAGGKDKGISYDEIGPAIIDNVKVLILIGATSKSIEDAVISECKKRNIDIPLKIHHAKTYPEAVGFAKDAAKENDVVLLSPASTSFDMFSNFEERGNLFKSIVNSL